MNIEYSEIKEFNEDELEELFLSVGWESGKYPDKLKNAMKNSSDVISAWAEGKLVGLIRGISDGETVAFIHYFLVNPKYQGNHIGAELLERLLEKYDGVLHIKVMPSSPDTIGFYEKFGFRQYDNYSALEICKFNLL